MAQQQNNRQQVAPQQQRPPQPTAEQLAQERKAKTNANMLALQKAFETQAQEIARMLPAQIPFERFKRVIMTAVQRNPDLLLVSARELFNACMQAASDGLLPDGREGALVIFNRNKKIDNKWVSEMAVQWMPMVAGILKKVRNSGELSTIVARVVYGGDKFRNWIDDTGEHIEYEASDQQDRELVRCVFAMAKLKDGSIEVEVLKPADIEKIRSVSRAKDGGPWSTWWDQMAIKSAIRRLSKRLPMSTDLDDLIRRDDALYDLEGAADKRGAIEHKPTSTATLANKLDMLGHDPETGEITDETTQQQNDPQTEERAEETDRGGRQQQDDQRKENANEPRDADDQKHSQDDSDHDGPQDGDHGEGDHQDDEADADHASDSAPPQPTAAERENMERQAELISIAQTKAQKGDRPLKLWIGSLKMEDYSVVKRAAKQIEAYLPQGVKFNWP